MGSKSPSDDHPAPLSPSSGKFKLTRTARIKKLILRGHDSAEDRKPDRAAVKMSGERKIRSPGRILLKKQRRMCEKKIESSRIRLSQGILQAVSYTHLYRDMQVREYHLHKQLQEKLWYRMADLFFDLAHDTADKIASAHPLYDRPAVRLPELVKESDPIIHHLSLIHI